MIGIVHASTKPSCKHLNRNVRHAVDHFGATVTDSDLPLKTVLSANRKCYFMIASLHANAGRFAIPGNLSSHSFSDFPAAPN